VININLPAINGHQTESFPVNCSVPQGSILGPVEFAAYTEDIIDLTERHRVRSHLNAMMMMMMTVVTLRMYLSYEVN